MKIWISALMFAACAVTAQMPEAQAQGQQQRGGGFVVVDPSIMPIPEPVVRPLPRPIMPSNTGAMYAMELRNVNLTVDILEQTAVTTIEQEFCNTQQFTIEGYYFFPIPQGASFREFDMWINGKQMAGEVLDAAKAKKIYEDIVRSAKDPALLEYMDYGLFRVRIFPIPAGGCQKIRLSYAETLFTDAGSTEYAYRLHNSTQQQTINNVTIKVHVKHQQGIKGVFSPTHDMDIKAKDTKQVVASFEGSNVSTLRDFKLFFNESKSGLGFSILPYREAGEEGYFLAHFSPGFGETEEVVEKDVVFVFDKSGSMVGKSMEQAQAALRYCVSSLNSGDRFEIIPFSTEAEPLFEGLRQADAAHKDRANDYISKLRAVGGTNIDDALSKALALKPGKERPYFIVFITDGKPTIGVTDEATLLKKIGQRNADNTRIFTFGIGTDLNTHLLDKMTEQTKAFRSYSLPDEDIELKVSTFFDKIASPVMTDLKIRVEGDLKFTGLYPKELPDMFKGSALTLAGRYTGTGEGTIILEGKVNGRAVEYKYPIKLAEKATNNDMVPNIWASRAVGYLMDQIRLHGETKELVDEVVRLSKKHGIITPYTSYLIIEDESQQLTMNRMRPDQAVMLPRAAQPVNAATGNLSMKDLEEVADSDLMKGLSSGYEETKSKKEGEAAVRLSMQNQAMNMNDKAVAAAKPDASMNYRDALGNENNLANGIVNLGSRAFYQNAQNEWVDANLAISKEQNQNVRKLKFNSDEYYKWLGQNKDAGNVLALGTNLRFVWNNEVIEVHE